MVCHTGKVPAVGGRKMGSGTQSRDDPAGASHFGYQTPFFSDGPAGALHFGYQTPICRLAQFVHQIVDRGD